MTLFAAYTGLRAAELAGLQIGDLTFTPGLAGVRFSVNVRRTKTRRGGVWVAGTLKSKHSRRTVPLPGWLAARMRDYLDTVHPRADEPGAPLWPNRAVGGSRSAERLAVSPLDFSEPVDPTAFYKNVLRPALVAVGLPASQQEHSRDDGTVVPAVKGVRLHDLRHTFATLQLSAGVHFMQVSKWLGHSTYTLTLDVYGDWIPEADGGVANSLPEPPRRRNRLTRRFCGFGVSRARAVFVGVVGLGLVVDLGPHYAVANPLNIHISGYPAKFVKRAYQLYAMPRLLNRGAVALAYLTDTMFSRSVVSIGLSNASEAEFSASEGIPLRKVN